MKTFWQMEQLLVIRKFSVCYNVFKGHLLQRLQEMSVCGKWLHAIHHCPHQLIKVIHVRFLSTLSHIQHFCIRQLWNHLEIVDPLVSIPMCSTVRLLSMCLHLRQIKRKDVSELFILKRKCKVTKRPVLTTFVVYHFWKYCG